jgi:glycosyltransferase involved in cell wall biosynthesis
LATSGFRVSLLTVSPGRRVWPQSSVEAGVQITETPNLLTLMYALGSGYGAIGIPYRVLYSLGNRFDLVHSFDHKPNVLLPAIFLNKLKETPLVADWSDWWGTSSDGSGLQEGKSGPVVKLETSMEHFIHRSADRVTTISTGLRTRAVALGIPEDKVSWIPSGAPSDVIRPLDRDACRERLGISRSIFLLSHLGMGEEDLSMVLPAITALRNKRREIRLGVIGPVGTPAAFQRSEVKDRVFLFGKVPFDQLSLYLGASDAFVLPLRETVVNQTRWPNKFGDYIAAGRPVLSSPVSDVAQYVGSGKCGMLWRDASELASSIDHVMDHPAEAARMGQSARILAEGELSWDTISERFSEVYRGIFGDETEGSLPGLGGGTTVA